MDADCRTSEWTHWTSCSYLLANHGTLVTLNLIARSRSAFSIILPLFLYWGGLQNMTKVELPLCNDDGLRLPLLWDAKPLSLHFAVSIWKWPLPQSNMSFQSRYPSGEACSGEACFNETLKEIEPCNPGPNEIRPADCSLERPFSTHFHRHVLGCSHSIFVDDFALEDICLYVYRQNTHEECNVYIYIMDIYVYIYSNRLSIVYC